MKPIKISVNGQDYAATLGLGFLGEILDVLDLDYTVLLEKYEKNPFKYVPLLMFHAIKWEADEAGEPIDFTLKEFRGWIDADGGLQNKAMLKFSEAFIQSIIKDVPQETIEEVKKSVEAEAVAEKK